ncbi:MAG: lipocalin family protein [Candidatus Sumerlaeia bacterium]
MDIISKAISVAIVGAVVGAALIGCASVPRGVAPVTGFDAERYLGKWYEIARLDHSFERGLDRVDTIYSKRPDGSIAVLNRGYDPAKRRWREARGVARFRVSKDVASFRVTFFWPFSGGYHVIALDRDYQWALVAGSSRKYLWILAREPRLDSATYERLVGVAREAGFPVESLIRVEQAQEGTRTDTDMHGRARGGEPQPMAEMREGLPSACRPDVAGAPLGAL